MLSRGCAIRPNCSGSSWLPSIPFECSGVERRHGDMAALTFREEGRSDGKKNKRQKVRIYQLLNIKEAVTWTEGGVAQRGRRNKT